MRLDWKEEVVAVFKNEVFGGYTAFTSYGRVFSVSEPNRGPITWTVYEEAPE